MISLYGEIKSYVARIKTLFSKGLDELSARSPPEQGGEAFEEFCNDVTSKTKLAVGHLITFGDDRGNLKAIFSRVCQSIIATR